MEIRKATEEDLEEIMAIYAYAREFMARTGNPKQWGATNWPPRALIEDDIRQGKCYVCADGNRLAAVFYYDCGEDIEPTYGEIFDGAWLDDRAYGVVHRIAAAEGSRGAGRFCLHWAFERCGHLRIDTHGDNQVMQRLLAKLGFQYRGVIYVEEDDDPRLAYEKI